ncbi:MAG: hypothetical protein PHD80_04225 [Candidatus ainarchaeum sp.]|nr:hypothetical protein [Candidatus ainarchaeum sp.]
MLKGYKRKLREKVTQRKKHPTQKIDSIIQLKKRIAKRNSLLKESASSELIFAKNNNKRGIKYAGNGKATITSVELSAKFASAKRLIHTHPLIVIGKKVIQLPSPSLSDIVTLFSLEKRSSMIAVLEKKGASRVAGYMVVKRTKKSEGIIQAIKQKRIKFGKETKENKSNPNYWTELLNSLNKKEYEKLRKDTGLVRAFELIRSKSYSLNQLNQNHKSTKEYFNHKIKELRYRYNANQIDQVNFYREIARIKQEQEASDLTHKRQVNQLSFDIDKILENERFELSTLHTTQTFLEKGVIQAIQKEETTKPTLNYNGFFRVKPTTKIDEKAFNKTKKEKERIFENMLGLHLRLVPAKGYKLINRQFEKIT